MHISMHRVTAVTHRTLQLTSSATGLPFSITIITATASDGSTMTVQLYSETPLTLEAQS